MTSSTLLRHHCVFYRREFLNFTDRSVNYTPNDVTMLMTSQIIFFCQDLRLFQVTSQYLPLLEPKILKVCTLDILVCKIHKILTFNILGSSNGIDLKLGPVVGLDKRR